MKKQNPRPRDFQVPSPLLAYANGKRLPFRPGLIEGLVRAAALFLL